MRWVCRWQALFSRIQPIDNLGEFLAEVFSAGEVQDGDVIMPCFFFPALPELVVGHGVGCVAMECQQYTWDIGKVFDYHINHYISIIVKITSGSKPNASR